MVCYETGTLVDQELDIDMIHPIYRHSTVMLTCGTNWPHINYSNVCRDM